MAVLIHLDKDENDLPDFEQLAENYRRIHELAKQGKIRAAHSVRAGGAAEAVSRMCLGNRIGFVFDKVQEDILFEPLYGSIVLEIARDEKLSDLFGNIRYSVLGYTQEKETIILNGEEILLTDIIEAWASTLESVFPTHVNGEQEGVRRFRYEKRNKHHPPFSIAAPRVFIPVFPGTNGEYDAARAFEKAGGMTDIMVFRNLTVREIEESLLQMAERIRNAQILMLPGGFSGDEPVKNGRFIEAAFRNPAVMDAVMELVEKRDGLILGIGSGFQALLRLGLLPYGEIRELDSRSPALVINSIGRHVSAMVQTRVASVLSPWFALCQLGDIHTVPFSHVEGRFTAGLEMIRELAENGQIATQYVDMEGEPAHAYPFNPAGSVHAVEGITSPDGRIFGKMCHSERAGRHVAKNIPGVKDQPIFESGIYYFK
jgi:phosphoribosylformylglycinamidine synthase